MKKGFTMIELIFVIVILGVLAAVAIPKLNATRDDAEQAKAMTNLATLMGDLTSYYTAQGTFADNIGSMTNVPLSVDANDTKKAEFKIKNDPCLSFEINPTNGTLTIASPAESPNPVCKNLIANTSTQNILSGTYKCKSGWTIKNVSQTDSVVALQDDTPANIVDENTDCAKVAEPSIEDLKKAPNKTIYAEVPAKIDAFGKKITMNFQGGGVAF